MRHLMLLVLLAACSEPVDPDPSCRWKDLSIEACEARCKTGNRDAEVCGVGDELACLDECLRCYPDVAWCPRN